MFYFKVILICLASLSTVEAIEKCGVPKHQFSIDKNGFPDCGADCAATVIFSGYRLDNAEYITIDMVADHYEPNDFMKLQFQYNNKLNNLTCNSKTIYRNKNADGLQCNWKLQLTGNTRYPITNSSILADLIVDEKIKNYIYFGLNGHLSPVASSLTRLIPYNESFPDCTEYDVVTYYDPKRLNKITLSKKKDSITGFIYALDNELNRTESVDRSIVFTDSNNVAFTVTCNNNFRTLSHYMTKYGLNDYSTDLKWTKFTGIPGLGKCGFTLPLKIYTTEYGWSFDFKKEPVKMFFNTTQPNASYYRSFIVFKYRI